MPPLASLIITTTTGFLCCIWLIFSKKISNKKILSRGINVLFLAIIVSIPILAIFGILEEGLFYFPSILGTGFIFRGLNDKQSIKGIWFIFAFVSYSFVFLAVDLAFIFLFLVIITFVLFVIWSYDELKHPSNQQAAEVKVYYTNIILSFILSSFFVIPLVLLVKYLSNEEIASYAHLNYLKDFFSSQESIFILLICAVVVTLVIAMIGFEKYNKRHVWKEETWYK